MKYKLIVFLLLTVFLSKGFGQIDTSKSYTWSRYMDSSSISFAPKYKIIEFRGDSLKYDSYAMSADAYLMLANLDCFGLGYWKILQKYNIRFYSDLQQQLEKIFAKEEELLNLIRFPK